MNCKCGAETLAEHIAKVGDGYPGHVYTGHYWAPTDDEQD